MATSEGVVARAIRGLNPVYFALVMATGIVSIASHLVGFPYIGLALLVINSVAYVVLWVMLLWRTARYRLEFLDDFKNHARAVGFFTIVAGTCVLGSQFLIIVHVPAIAIALWVIGFILYFVLIYSVFTVLSTREKKPSLGEGINGGWLVSIVATQGVSLLGTQISEFFPGLEQAILLFSLAAWLAGGALYTWVITLIFYRYLFFPLKPEDLGPPYWIDMGAMAISTLAGALLIAKSEHVIFLERIGPFIEGFTLVFWATATWWIPMILLLGFWRYVIRRSPFRYDPGYWGMVFPLGMYTTCTYKLAQAPHLDFLLVIPTYFYWVALVAWGLTFLGLLHTLSKTGRVAA